MLQCILRDEQVDRPRVWSVPYSTDIRATYCVRNYSSGSLVMAAVVSKALVEFRYSIIIRAFILVTTITLVVVDSLSRASSEHQQHVLADGQCLQSSV